MIGLFLRFNLITFYEPTLAVKLELKYHFNPDGTAFFYAISTFSDFVSMIVYSKYPFKTKYRRWLISGTILGIISLLFFGPSNLLPDNIYFMAFVSALRGVCAAIINMSAVLYLMENLKNSYPNEHD